MKNKITLLLFALSQLIISAQTVNIPGDPHTGNPYATITDAIFAAIDGDVILITGEHTEAISINKSITIKGSDPTTDIIQAAATAASDGSGTNVIKIVRFENADVLNVTVENLSIRHGNTNSTNGGGIDADKVTGLLTLKNLIIEDNYTVENGGGLSIAGSNAEIIDCTIRNNTSVKNGGGIITVPNNASGIDNIVNIKQSLIDNNTANNGGGIYINGNNQWGNDYKIAINIENTTISNNLASSKKYSSGGGAIWSKVAEWMEDGDEDETPGNITLQLVHATVYNNTHVAANKNGIVFDGVSKIKANFSAYNSIIVNNDVTSDKAINFENANTTEITNCILGGLARSNKVDFDITSRNNEIGKTATFAGLTGSLESDGGKTQVIKIAAGSNSSNFCTASTAIALPTIDQRGFLRDATPDAGAFEYYNIWTGSDTDFTNASNWSNGTPITGGLVHIKTADNMPTASSAIDVSTIVMDSGTSFITTSTYVGNLVYHRNLETTNWYLIGSPVLGQDEDDFVSIANFAYGTGSNRGFANYNTLNDDWTYYDGPETSNDLNAGIGYSVKKMVSGDISFSGTMLTDNLNPITLDINGNGFNLVSNPYPSFINSGSLLDLESNTASLASKTIWIWDQSVGTYEAKISDETFKVAPGQAFFVKSDGAAGTLSINEEFQSHETDLFLKSDSKTAISLQLTSENSTRKARLYYVDEATKGFDNGFDGSLFKGVQNPFAIYSHLASLENGEDLQVQSVPKTAMESTVIPIGINALSGKEITIQASISNVSEDLKVFLEDRENSTFTELNTSSKFKTTLNSKLNGSGRFYLHTRGSALNIRATELQDIKVYNVNKNEIKIDGLFNEKAQLKIYNALGALVFNKNINSKFDYVIEVPNFNKGVYIVNIKTKKGSTSKKLILNN